MRYRNSVFDEYAKIARQQGLISEAAEEETNPRYDSKDISTIELLYHVKPNGEQKHIVEQAHPDMVYIAPAHDRMNGVVENGLEQQNVSLNVARKPPIGSHMYRRYVQAQEELLETVIKTSCWLDRENSPELMKMSDSCLEKMTKEAALPILPIVGVVALITLLGGAVYKLNNPESHGFLIDLSLAQKEIGDAVGDYPELNKTLQPLLSNLKSLQEAFNASETDRAEIKTSLMELAGASTDQEKRKLIQINSTKFFKSKKYDSITKSLNTLKALAEATLKLIPGAIDELTNARGRFEKPLGTWQGISEMWESAKDIYHKFIPSDAQDAVKALTVLGGSISDLFGGIQDQLQGLNELKSQVDSFGQGSKDQELQDLLHPEKKAPSPGGVSLQPSVDWA